MAGSSLRIDLFDARGLPLGADADPRRSLLRWGRPGEWVLMVNGAPVRAKGIGWSRDLLGRKRG
jgi:hypothetical protein